MYNQAELELPAQGKEPCVLCLTILIITMGGGYWQMAVVGLAIFALTTTSLLASTSASITFNYSYVCEGQDIGFTVDVSHTGTAQPHLDINSAVGWLECTDITGGHYYSPFYEEATSDIVGDSFWVEVWVDGVKIEENNIPLLRLTGFYSFAGGKSTSAVAVGQRADFKVTLNDYAGNSTNWGPSELWFDSVDGSSGSWANKTWSSPYLETVHAYGIGPGAALDIWVVSAQIKTVTFTGPGFAAVKRDDNGQTYATPHYDITVPYYNPPVQYRRGTQPTMDLEFEVSPPEYTGPVKVRSLTELLTPTNHLNHWQGLGILFSLQTIETLTDSVGYDSNLSLAWDYSVAADVFYSANSSYHKIYRTLDSPSLHYHTSVHVACNAVSGTTYGVVLTNTWAKFTSLSVLNQDGLPLSYWSPVPPPAIATTVAGLVASRNGNCTAWADFLVDCWSVHNISSYRARVMPPTTVHGFIVGLPPEMGMFTSTAVYGLNVFENIDAQNNNTPACGFNLHDVVRCNLSIFDPSYGRSYYTEAEYEGQSISSYTVQYIYQGVYYYGNMINPLGQDCIW